MSDPDCRIWRVFLASILPVNLVDLSPFRQAPILHGMKTPAPGTRFARVVHVLSWVMVCLAAGGATFVGIVTILSASSAPEQAAGAALACAMAIIPYVFARSLEELFT